MITKVNGSPDFREALNENMVALVTGKRKPEIAREVNKTLKLFSEDVSNEVKNNALMGNRDGLSWFGNKTIRIEANKPKALAAPKKKKVA